MESTTRTNEEIAAALFQNHSNGSLAIEITLGPDVDFARGHGFQSRSSPSTEMYILYFHDDQEYICIARDKFHLVAELMIPPIANIFKLFGQSLWDYQDEEPEIARLSPKVEIQNYSHNNECLITQTDYNQIFIEDSPGATLSDNPLGPIVTPDEILRAETIRRYALKCQKEGFLMYYLDFAIMAARCGRARRTYRGSEVPSLIMFPSDYPHADAAPIHIPTRLCHSRGRITIPFDGINDELAAMIEITIMGVRDIRDLDFGHTISRDDQDEDELLAKYIAMIAYLNAHILITPIAATAVTPSIQQ